MGKIFRFLLWLTCVLVLAAAGVEVFCFLFPLRPINRPNLNRLVDMPEFQAQVRTNSLGLREDEEIPTRKKSGEKRIFLIGDSFAFGFGLEKRDTIAEQLQHSLKTSSPATSMRVINAGSPGTGPLHYALCVRNIAIPLHADTVIAFFYVGNDMENTHEPYLAFPYSLKNRLKIIFPNSYLWASGWKYNRRAPANAPQKVGLDAWSTATLHRWGKREGLSPEECDKRKTALPPQVQEWLDQREVNPAYLYDALTHPQILNDRATLKSEGMRQAMQRCEVALRQIKKMCARAGARFVLVVAPASYQVNEEQWDFWRTVGYALDPAEALKTAPQEELKRFCAKEGIAFLDLLPALQKSGIRPLHYARDEHWRPETARYVTQVLSDFLKGVRS